MRKWQDEVERFFAKVAQTDDIQSFDPREFIEAGEHVTVLGFERFVSPGQKGSWPKPNGFGFRWHAACWVIGGRPRMLQFEQSHRGS
ncbi:hypothetical protein AWV80_32340 [Cupriavidus sp. UYMU48A]|nr:hypothetical protein AWV80_32340 [Cupriavidus sp. UYMU48A]